MKAVHLDGCPVPGPLVLTLPEVPEGAIALIDRMERRWTPAKSGANWETRVPNGELTNWRTLGNLLGDPKQDVPIGADVEAVFEPHDDAKPPFTLVQWKLA